MSDADRLHELLGLPAVEFQREAEEATRPPAGAVAWRVSVDPYDGDVAWEAEFEAFLEAVDPSGVEALIIGQWGESYEETSAYPIGLVVAAADRLTSLRAVFVGDLVAEEAEISWIEQSDVTALLTAFPQLTHLGVRGGTGLTFPRSSTTPCAGSSSRAEDCPRRRCAACWTASSPHWKAWISGSGSPRTAATWSSRTWHRCSRVPASHD